MQISLQEQTDTRCTEQSQTQTQVTPGKHALQPGVIFSLLRELEDASSKTQLIQIANELLQRIPFIHLTISTEEEHNLMVLTQTCNVISCLASRPELGILHDLVRVCDAEFIAPIIKHFPELLMTQRLGWLPLHEASRYQGGNTNLIRLLLSGNPKAAQIRTPNGSLPLHLVASCHGYNTEAMSLFLEAYPQSARERSSVTSDSRESFSEDPNGWYPLHYTIRYFGDHIGSVKMLLESSPFVVVQKCNGWLPGHLALRYYPNNRDLLELILYAYPGALIEPLPDGILPFYLWQQCGGSVSDMGELLIEIASRCGKEYGIALSIIKYLTGFIS